MYLRGSGKAMPNMWRRYTDQFRQASEMRHLLYKEEQRQRFDVLIRRLMEANADTMENGSHSEAMKCYKMLCRRCMAHLTGTGVYGKDDFGECIRDYIDAHPLAGTVSQKSAVYGWYLLPLYCEHLYGGQSATGTGLLSPEDREMLCRIIGEEKIYRFASEFLHASSEQILNDRSSLYRILRCTADGLMEPLYRLLIEMPLHMEEELS